MKLFHVSEQPDIAVFHPRTPTRADLDPRIPLVWAIDEMRLPNFLTPRDCPRVAWHVGPSTTHEDRLRFFSSPTACHAVAIAHPWVPQMLSTTLYLYEFDPTHFALQDGIAGYYVSTRTQTPLARHTVPCPLAALAQRQVEFRAVDDLHPLMDALRQSSLNWSFCRIPRA